MYDSSILYNNYIKIHCYIFLLMMNLIFYLIFKNIKYKYNNKINTKFIFHQLYILKYKYH